MRLTGNTLRRCVTSVRGCWFFPDVEASFSSGFVASAAHSAVHPQPLTPKPRQDESGEGTSIGPSLGFQV